MENSTNTIPTLETRLQFPQVVQTTKVSKTLLALPDVLLLNSKLRKRAQRWTLAYILDRHSQNWDTLKQAIYGKGQTIIVIQDANGDIFGMYGSHRWVPTEGFFGNDECFLFTLKPDVNIYEGSGRDNNFQLFNESGIGMGGSEDTPGLFIQYDTVKGKTSLACRTFRGFWPLARELEFKICQMEIWAVEFDESKEAVAEDNVQELICSSQYTKTTWKEVDNEPKRPEPERVEPDAVRYSPCSDKQEARCHGECAMESCKPPGSDGRAQRVCCSKKCSKRMKVFREQNGEGDGNMRVCAKQRFPRQEEERCQRQCKHSVELVEFKTENGKRFRTSLDARQKHGAPGFIHPSLAAEENERNAKKAAEEAKRNAKDVSKEAEKAEREPSSPTTKHSNRTEVSKKRRLSQERDLSQKSSSPSDYRTVDNQTQVGETRLMKPTCRTYRHSNKCSCTRNTMCACRATASRSPSPDSFNDNIVPSTASSRAIRDASQKKKPRSNPKPPPNGMREKDKNDNMAEKLPPIDYGSIPPSSSSSVLIDVKSEKEVAKPTSDKEMKVSERPKSNKEIKVNSERPKSDKELKVNSERPKSDKEIKANSDRLKNEASNPKSPPKPEREKSPKKGDQEAMVKTKTNLPIVKSDHSSKHIKTEMPRREKEKQKDALMSSSLKTYSAPFEDKTKTDPRQDRLTQMDQCRCSSESESEEEEPKKCDPTSTCCCNTRVSSYVTKTNKTVVTEASMSDISSSVCSCILDNKNKMTESPALTSTSRMKETQNLNKSRRKSDGSTYSGTCCITYEKNRHACKKETQQHLKSKKYSRTSCQGALADSTPMPPTCLKCKKLVSQQGCQCVRNCNVRSAKENENITKSRRNSDWSTETTSSPMPNQSGEKDSKSLKSGSRRSVVMSSPPVQDWKMERGSGSLLNSTSSRNIFDRTSSLSSQSRTAPKRTCQGSCKCSLSPQYFPVFPEDFIKEGTGGDCDCASYNDLRFPVIVETPPSISREPSSAPEEPVKPEVEVPQEPEVKLKKCGCEDSDNTIIILNVSKCDTADTVERLIRDMEEKAGEPKIKSLLFKCKDLTENKTSPCSTRSEADRDALKQHIEKLLRKKNPTATSVLRSSPGHSEEEQ